MTNIYSWASNNDVDFYDKDTQRLYKVSEYNFAIRMGIPTPGIAIYDSLGRFLGYASKEDNE